MQEPEYTLYWEDVDERLVYAELDDRSWLSPEKLYGYKKSDSLYIYHHGKLAAFYSTKDTEEEARVGYTFFSDDNNVLRIIQIKKEAKQAVDAFVTSGRELDLATLSDKQLKELILEALSHCLKSLHAHFLTQAQFFEKFESEGGLDHVQRFEELSKARFEYSRKAWSTALGFSHSVFTEYGRRHGLTLAEAESMTREELINGVPDKNVLAARADTYVIASKFHDQTIFIGTEATAYIKKYEQYEDIGLVKGVIGNRGVVTAPAFVLKNEHLDLKKLPAGMKKGMVLIVQNSWPELSEYYAFASAIVTNEGGITSHGVVVAREFGIPCIVATRIGTKVFNTGDMVEVDANKGIVRKIS